MDPAPSPKRATSILPGTNVLRYVGGQHLTGDGDAEAALAEASFARLLRQRPRDSWICLDFLSFRATGQDSRSPLHDRLQVDPTSGTKTPVLVAVGPRLVLEQIGLGELLLDGARRIGADVRPVGDKVGRAQDALSAR